MITGLEDIRGPHDMKIIVINRMQIYSMSIYLSSDITLN